MYMHACLMWLVNSYVDRGKDYITRECRRTEESCMQQAFRAEAGPLG